MTPLLLLTALTKINLSIKNSIIMNFLLSKNLDVLICDNILSNYLMYCLFGVAFFFALYTLTTYFLDLKNKVKSKADLMNSPKEPNKKVSRRNAPSPGNNNKRPWWKLLLAAALAAVVVSFVGTPPIITATAAVGTAVSFKLKFFIVQFLAILLGFIIFEEKSKLDNEESSNDPTSWSD